MPKKARTVASQIYQDAVKNIRGGLKKLQEPSTDNVLLEQLKGFVGGAGEAVTDYLLPQDPEADLGLDPTVGMVQIPKQFVRPFANNFIKRVPERLAKTGNPEAAQVMEDFGKKYPSLVGRLQEVSIGPIQGAPLRLGQYTSDIIDDAGSLADMQKQFPLEQLVDMGATAPTNNRISINMALHGTPLGTSGINPGRAMQNYDPMETMIHEGAHLAEDILGRRDLVGALDTTYALDPNEVLARIASKQAHGPKVKATPQNVIEEMLNGLHNYSSRMEYFGQDGPEILADQMRSSLNEILRRARGFEKPSQGPGGWVVHKDFIDSGMESDIQKAIRMFLK